MATFLGNITQPTYTIPTGISTSPVVNITNGGGSWSTGYAFANTASTTIPTVHIKGSTEIEGNLTVNGMDIVDMLERIESHLGIVRPNKDLEQEFDELRALGDAYRAAEKKFKEQKRVFEILKTQDQ